MSESAPSASANLPLAHLVGPVHSVAGLETGMLNVGGFSVRVGHKVGAGETAPLLIFNGIGANIELLEPFVQAMGDTGIITFDIPGVGHSALPARPYGPRRMAQLAHDIVTLLGYEKVNVIGVSWGGVLAQEFARRHATVCQRLILAATTTGFVMVPGRLRALMGMATPRRYVDRDYLRRSVGQTYGGIFRRQPELALALLRHVRWQSRMGYYLQLLALAGWTSVHWLHRLPQPTLVMSGDDDPITRPLNAKLQFALLRDAQFWRIDCGHLFLLTRPEESAAAIRAFLQNHKSGDLT